MASSTDGPFDVFVSFTRKGHPKLARYIGRELQRAGLQIFIDDDVPYGDRISQTVTDALERSKLLVVVYSKSYLERDACQWELMHFYLAAMAEGDASRRILVVNPEESGDHIVPVELRDARYVVADGEISDSGGFVRVVKQRVDALRPVGKILDDGPPRWLPSQIPGMRDFVGRYRDLWRLHAELCTDLPLTHATSGGPVAVVSGLPGVGKTSLVSAYAWKFGVAYPGGVYGTSLRGTDLSSVRSRQAENFRQLAASAGISVVGVEHEELTMLLARHLDEQPGPSLLMIDDLPGGLDPDVLNDLVVPARRLRTVFTSRSADYRQRAGLIPLTGLSEADGVRLLDSLRPLEGEADRIAARSISARLGGHPLALQMAGASLRNGEGLRSYEEYAASLTADLGSGPDEEHLRSVIAGFLDPLGTSELLAVELAHVLGAQPVPAWLIDSVLQAVADGAMDTSRVLGQLEHMAAATRDGAWWHVHPLVCQAVHREGRVAKMVPSVAFAAARALCGSAMRLEPDVIPLVETLAASPPLAGSEDGCALHSLAAMHYEVAGDAVQAARVRMLIADARPGSAQDLTSAALACNAIGEHDHAERLARLALDLAGDFTSVWAMAAALDGQGRYGDADALWRRLDAAEPPATLTEDRMVSCQVARAEAYQARGQLGDAVKLLEEIRRAHDLAKAGDALASQINAAVIQLAKARLATSKARDSRSLASSVVEYYRSRGAETHHMCREAELVRAEATVNGDLFELRPDTSQWGTAELSLRGLYESYRVTVGPESALTLKAGVQYALVLIRLGQQSRSRAVLGEVRPALDKRFEEQHPLRLRAQYILGLAHLQLCEFDQARKVLERTWHGQRTTLGPYHYETLSTQLELGIVLKFYDQQRMRELITDLRRHLPAEVGRGNDLYGRALMAQVLLFPMPVRAARLLWRFGDLANKLLPFRNREEEDG